MTHELTPYAHSARAYFDSGWSPIPLPHEKKSPVPDGFTGASGAYVDVSQLRRWLAPRARASAGSLNFAPSNIAIRLPRDILGIDVDAYGSKKGAKTLERAEQAWGPLPATWVSTSKRDGLSGIRLFRIPEGLAWPGGLPQGGGVDLIRWDHRYMVVQPSIHDLTSEEYRWCRIIDGELVDSLEEFPDADDVDIPVLPDEWVEGLTAGESWQEKSVGEELNATQIQEWLGARPRGVEPCYVMRALISKGQTALAVAGDDGGAHDKARDIVWGVLNDAKAGHPGVVKALTELRETFLASVKGRRDTERQARSEWARTVSRGIAKVDANGSPYEAEDPCDSASKLGSGIPGEGGGRLNGGDLEECNNKGNGNRLFRVMNGTARWVEAHGAWYLWDGRMWSADRDRKVERWSVKAIDQIDEEIALCAGHENSEAEIKARKKWQKSSYEIPKLVSMREMVKGRKGISVSVAALDANPAHLGIANGILELGESGVRLLPFTPEAYITKTTGVPWEPALAAGGPLWGAFLDRFIPDEGVRDWAQRIAGYSLLGSNSGRKIVALIGDTSTGKSTFAEAIRRVLGDYGAVMQASILRGNQDDRARPDLLDAFGRRVIVAEELGEVQHLHADQVKRLTGNTPISARGMRSNDFTSLTPAFTPWIVANSVPHIEGADRATERRLLVIPFDQEIEHSAEDLGYCERMIRDEAAGILAWCVEGYQMWLRDPRLEEIPLGAVAAARGFREGMNDFNGFCAEKLDDDKEAFTFPTQAYQAYQIWCAENGIQQRDILNGRKFGIRMTARYGRTRSKKVEAKVVKVYAGVRLVL